MGAERPGPDVASAQERDAVACVADVLGLDPRDLRADTPTGDLGLDDVALVCAADLLAARWAPSGWLLRDDALAGVRTIGDLAATLAAGPGEGPR